MKRSSGVFIALISASSLCLGFDTDTHGFITHQGYLKSNLAGPGPLRERLGFDRLDELTPFRIYFELPTLGNRDAYLDLLPGSSFGLIPDPYASSVPYRPSTEYERQSFAYTSGPAVPGSNSGLFPTPQRVEAAIVRGVVREDDLLQSDYRGEPLRPDADPHGDFRHVANHFYDPINNRPLVLPGGVPCETPFLLETPCNRSIDWAMGETDAQASVFNPQQTRRNHFSWVDAREAMWRALTFKSTTSGAADYATRQAQDSGIRRNFWHTTLKSVGHVVHLLQDAAQPQHTRNDRHNPGYLGFDTLGGTSFGRRTMEAYTNYRVTGNALSAPSDEQEVLRGLFNRPVGSGLLSPPPVGAYPVPQFSRPLKFFTTRVQDAALGNRRGLADYSNRGFYSEGTLPQAAPGFTSPPLNLQDPSFTPGDSQDFFLPGHGTLVIQKKFWAVPDPVAPSYADTCLRDGKLQLFSVAALQEYTDLSTQPAPAGLLALDDYKCHQDALLPRAIAYTTGLVNHFFRGELEIAAFPQRVLGAVDQGVPHTVDADGYPRRTGTSDIHGFKTIRLRVRNVTPDIVESGTATAYPQTLGGSNGPSVGVLVAVARYHRNPCYKTDMTGERRVRLPLNGSFTPPSGCPAVGSRTRYQEISVSQEMPVGLGELGAGPSSAFVDKVFNFSADPIPINATDLFIQVVYRGPMGEEPDGFALGTYDAREPMFATFWNNTDYSNVGGNYQFTTQTGVFRKVVQDFQFCAGTGADRTILVHHNRAATGLAAMPFPEPAGFMRFAVITARPVTTENVSFRGNVSFMNPQPPAPFIRGTAAVKGTINQANKELIGTTTEPFPLPSDPLADCPLVPPMGTPFLWCVEPLAVRRGLVGGKVGVPIFLDQNSATPTPPDAGTLPEFTQAPVQRAGENLWEQPTLTTCPNSITEIPAILDEILLLEEQLAGMGGG